MPPLLPSASETERREALNHTADRVTGFSRVTLDIDPGEVAPIAEVLAECARQGAPPTCVVSRGGGSAQLWWRLGPSYPAASFAPTLVALAARLGGDPGATGSTLLMRLGGFWHRRTAAPLRLDIIYETGCIYELDELVQRLELDLGAKLPPRATGPRRASPRPGTGTATGGHQDATEPAWLAALGARLLHEDPAARSS